MHLNIFELKLGAYIRYGKTRRGHKSSVRRKNFPYVRNTSFWCHAYNQGELCSNFFLQNVKIVSNSRTFWKFKTVHWRIKLKEAEIKFVRSQKRSSVQLFWNYCQPFIFQEKSQDEVIWIPNLFLTATLSRSVGSVLQTSVRGHFL